MQAKILFSIIAAGCFFTGNPVIGAVSALIALIAYLDEQFDPENPGTCRKCGREKGWRGYEGDTVCFFCEREDREASKEC